MSPSSVVWHVSSNRWNSAITEYALSCARALGGAGYRSVFSPTRGSPAERRALEYGLETRSFDGFGVGAMPAFWRMAGEIRPDVLITYGGTETSLATACKGMGRRFRLIRFRGQSMPANRLVARWRHRVGNAGVDAYLAPGAILAAEMAPFVGQTPVRPVILGVDTAKFFHTSRFPGVVERPEALVVGRFDPIKGHAVMARVFRGVLDRWPESSPRPLLRVIGEEANLKLEDLTRSALDAGLRMDRDFTIERTRHPDIAGAMTRATVGCVPSLGSEIICRVAQEFLLCGTPVAVSGVGSLDEVLFPTAGMTFRGLSEESRSERLRDLMWNAWNESPAMRRSRAEAAAELFSFKAMARDVAALFD